MELDVHSKNNWWGLLWTESECWLLNVEKENKGEELGNVQPIKCEIRKLARLLITKNNWDHCFQFAICT